METWGSFKLGNDQLKLNFDLKLLIAFETAVFALFILLLMLE